MVVEEEELSLVGQATKAWSPLQKQHTWTRPA
eukprot:SAG22_NODE_13090_length_419_cov_1.093750_1_plen_31_part_01